MAASSCRNASRDTHELISILCLMILDNLLACPVCKNEKIEFFPERAFCSLCHRTYPIAHSGDQKIINFIPDSHSPYINPIQRLWKHLLHKSSRAIEPLLEDPDLFKVADTEYAELNIEGRKILDIGGNSGELRRHLKTDQMYVCLEPNREAYERRLLLGKIDPKLSEHFIFVQGTAEYLPFRASSFDSVVMRSVLEHVFDLNFVFAETQRVLKPEGNLFVSSDFHGIMARDKRKTWFQKTVTYWKKHGNAATVKRVASRLSFNVRRGLNPWKEFLDFSEPQLEAGHMYDDLRGEAIKDLAERFGFSLHTSLEIDSAMVFIFRKTFP